MKPKSLHHYSKLNAYQFVTFRTTDSIDDYLYRINKIKDLTISQKQMKIDNYCDQSAKGCYFNGETTTLMIEYLKQLEDYYCLIALSIMPNHAHLLFQQKRELEKIMQKIKGGSAFLINKQLKKQGSFWERGYFDKAIRDESHFLLVYDYIKNNAIKAELKDANLRFYGIYE